MNTARWRLTYLTMYDPRAGGAGRRGRDGRARAAPRLLSHALPDTPPRSHPHWQVQKLTKGEMLMVNIGSTSVGGRVVALKGETVAHLSLTMPVCTQTEEKVALSRRVEGHWRCVRSRSRARVRAASAPFPPPALPLIRIDKLSLSELG